MILAFGHVKTIFQGQFLADVCTPQPLVFVGYGPAVIIYPVVGNMYMGMLLVEMSGYKELCVPYVLY